jgi:hypothetical protein
VLEAPEPARERRARGAGIAVAEPDKFPRERGPFGRPRRVESDAFVGPSSVDSFGSVGGAPLGELRKASAITSFRGGLRGPAASAPAVDVSYNPKRGRGGRSGVAFPLLGSGTEAERLRLTTTFSSSADGVPLVITLGDRSGVREVEYSWIMDSLILRCVSCLFGAAGVPRGKLVAISPNFSCSGDGGYYIVSTLSAKI